MSIYGRLITLTLIFIFINGGLSDELFLLDNDIWTPFLRNPSSLSSVIIHMLLCKLMKSTDFPTNRHLYNGNYKVINMIIRWNITRMTLNFQQVLQYVQFHRWK